MDKLHTLTKTFINKAAEITGWSVSVVAGGIHPNDPNNPTMFQ